MVVKKERLFKLQPTNICITKAILLARLERFSHFLKQLLTVVCSIFFLLLFVHYWSEGTVILKPCLI